jgi:hypothetical protein
MAKTSKNGNEPQYLSTTEYLGCRDGYDKAELEVSGRYDQWILTLSGGALAVSITFIEKIAPAPDVHTLHWLKWSWVLLVVSLLVVLVSLLTSQSAIREQRRELDKAFQDREPPAYKTRKWFTCLTNLLNWGSALFFVAGVSCLCMFAFTNAPKQKEEQANDRRQAEQPPATIDRGICAADTAKDGRKGLCPTIAATQITGQAAIATTNKQEVISGDVK